MIIGSKNDRNTETVKNDKNTETVKNVKNDKNTTETAETAETVKKPNVFMSLLGAKPSTSTVNSAAEEVKSSVSAQNATTTVSNTIAEILSSKEPKPTTMATASTNTEVSSVLPSIISATVTEIISDAFSVGIDRPAGKEAVSSRAASSSISKIDGVSTIAPIKLSFSASDLDKKTYLSRLPASVVYVSTQSETQPSSYSIAPNSVSRSEDTSPVKSSEMSKSVKSCEMSKGEADSIAAQKETKTIAAQKETKTIAAQKETKTIGNNNSSKSIQAEVKVIKKLAGDKQTTENYEISTSSDEKAGNKKSPVSNFIDVLRDISEGNKSKEKIFVDGKMQSKTKDGQAAGNFSFEGWVINKDN